MKFFILILMVLKGVVASQDDTPYFAWRSEDLLQQKIRDLETYKEVKKKLFSLIAVELKKYFSNEHARSETFCATQYHQDLMNALKNIIEAEDPDYSSSNVLIKGFAEYDENGVCYKKFLKFIKRDVGIKELDAIHELNTKKETIQNLQTVLGGTIALPQIYGTIEFEGIPYMFTLAERVKGINLKEFLIDLYQKKPLDWQLRAKKASNLLGNFTACMHQYGFTHGDYHLGNVFYDEDAPHLSIIDIATMNIPLNGKYYNPHLFSADVSTQKGIAKDFIGLMKSFYGISLHHITDSYEEYTKYFWDEFVTSYAKASAHQHAHDVASILEQYGFFSYVAEGLVGSLWAPLYAGSLRNRAITILRTAYNFNKGFHALHFDYEKKSQQEKKTFDENKSSFISMY